jgi:hypothetical protein
VSGQLHAPAALPLGKEPRYPMDRRLGGTKLINKQEAKHILLLVRKMDIPNIYEGVSRSFWTTTTTTTNTH